jgi:hypothetical protein
MARSARFLALALATLAGCAPQAGALRGAPAPARLPVTELPPGRQRLDFRWEYRDGDLAARGEGVARLASPDSVRLDLFLDGGLGGGYAIVIGKEIFTPSGDQARRVLPPAPLLWATLGRLAVPAAPDTTARVDGGRLRADIGRDPTWRATFDSTRLTRLERIEGGRVLEWTERGVNGRVRYENTLAQRALTLDVTRTQEASEFDAAIWRH